MHPSALIALCAVVVFSCGGADPEATTPQPPNVHEACGRAQACGVFLDVQHDACVACLEHVDPRALEQIAQIYPQLPPLEQVDCQTVTDVARRYTNLAQCVVGRWYGP